MGQLARCSQYQFSGEPTTSDEHPDINAVPASQTHSEPQGSSQTHISVVHPHFSTFWIYSKSRAVPFSAFLESPAGHSYLQ